MTPLGHSGYIVPFQLGPTGSPGPGVVAGATGATGGTAIAYVDTTVPSTQVPESGYHVEQTILVPPPQSDSALVGVPGTPADLFVVIVISVIALTTMIVSLWLRVYVGGTERWLRAHGLPP